MPPCTLHARGPRFPAARTKATLALLTAAVVPLVQRKSYRVMESSTPHTLASMMEALRREAERERERGNAAFAAGKRGVLAWRVVSLLARCNLTRTHRRHGDNGRGVHARAIRGGPGTFGNCGHNDSGPPRVCTSPPRRQDGEVTVVLYSNRAAALTKLGRFADALSDADKAAARRPDWAKAHFRRATALLGLARYADALAAFDAGLALEPQNESLVQGRQLALSALGRHTEAPRCVLVLELYFLGCLHVRHAEWQASLSFDISSSMCGSSSSLDKALARLEAAPPPAPVPVLVLSGFLGAGKTTLLQRLLTHASGMRLAVLVNDMAEINIDAQMVASTLAATPIRERVVALTNGCICCTLRDDLLTEVSRMAGTIATCLV